MFYLFIFTEKSFHRDMVSSMFTDQRDDVVGNDASEQCLDRIFLKEVKQKDHTVNKSCLFIRVLLVTSVRATLDMHCVLDYKPHCFCLLIQCRDVIVFSKW